MVQPGFQNQYHRNKRMLSSEVMGLRRRAHLPWGQAFWALCDLTGLQHLNFHLHTHPRKSELSATYPQPLEKLPQ